MILPVWVKPAIAAVALLAAFSGGWKVQGWRCAAAQKEALEQAQERFEKQLAQANERALEYETAREAVRTESRERETEIRTIYRDRVVPAVCEPDPAAVGLLRDAVRAANADPAEPGG